jgi:hypothetical protein
MKVAGLHLDPAGLSVLRSEHASKRSRLRESTCAAGVWRLQLAVHHLNRHLGHCAAREGAVGCIASSRPLANERSRMACEVLFQEVPRTCRGQIDAGTKHVRQLPNGRTQPYSRSPSVNNQKARFCFVFYAW